MLFLKWGESQIVSGGKQISLFFLVIEERKILGMVVFVARKDVEASQAKSTLNPSPSFMIKIPIRERPVLEKRIQFFGKAESLCDFIKRRKADLPGSFKPFDAAVGNEAAIRELKLGEAFFFSDLLKLFIIFHRESLMKER